MKWFVLFVVVFPCYCYSAATSDWFVESLSFCSPDTGTCIGSWTQAETPTFEVTM